METKNITKQKNIQTALSDFVKPTTFNKSKHNNVQMTLSDFVKPTKLSKPKQKNIRITKIEDYLNLKKDKKEATAEAKKQTQLAQMFFDTNQGTLTTEKVREFFNSPDKNIPKNKQSSVVDTTPAQKMVNKVDEVNTNDVQIVNNFKAESAKLADNIASVNDVNKKASVENNIPAPKTVNNNDGVNINDVQIDTNLKAEPINFVGNIANSIDINKVKIVPVQYKPMVFNIAKIYKFDNKIICAGDIKPANPISIKAQLSILKFSAKNLFAKTKMGLKALKISTEIGLSNNKLRLGIEKENIKHFGEYIKSTTTYKKAQIVLAKAMNYSVRNKEIEVQPEYDFTQSTAIISTIAEKIDHANEIIKNSIKPVIQEESEIDNTNAEEINTDEVNVSAQAFEANKVDGEFSENLNLKNLTFKDKQKLCATLAESLDEIHNNQNIINTQGKMFEDNNIANLIAKKEEITTMQNQIQALVNNYKLISDVVISHSFEQCADNPQKTKELIAGSLNNQYYDFASTFNAFTKRLEKEIKNFEDLHKEYKNDLNVINNNREQIENDCEIVKSKIEQISAQLPNSIIAFKLNRKLKQEVAIPFNSQNYCNPTNQMQEIESRNNELKLFVNSINKYALLKDVVKIDNLEL